MTPTAEFKLVALRETSAPHTRPMGDTPASMADYFRTQVEAGQTFQPTVENLVVIFVNTRRRITGHAVIATGTLDTILVHAREVFRMAIVKNASAIVLAHNHPSCDPSPSEGDIKVTRDLIRAGKLLGIELLDHVVIGHPENQPRDHASLRELGYFYN